MSKKNLSRTLAGALATVVLMTGTATPVLAQSFPSKPLTMIVGYRAGGGTDTLARAAADPLSKILGQPVLVQNKPGAGGGVAALFTSKTPPDGHTFVVTTSTTYTLEPQLQKVAYEPVKELNLGIVAKIDLAEVQAPFIKAVLTSSIVGIFAVAIGAVFFVYITNPLLRKLSRTIENLKVALSEVKQLSGLLPICASCKKIRDDKGYWNQIESYISHHTEAEFSHGICPDCAERLYPELDLSK